MEISMCLIRLRKPPSDDILREWCPSNYEVLFADSNEASCSTSPQLGFKPWRNAGETTVDEGSSSQTMTPGFLQSNRSLNAGGVSPAASRTPPLSSSRRSSDGSSRGLNVLPSLKRHVTSGKNKENHSPLAEEFQLQPLRQNKSSSCLFGQLPRCRMTYEKEPTEVVLQQAAGLLGGSERDGACVRAVSVSLWHSEPSTPSQSSCCNNHSFSGALFCVPILSHEESVKIRRPGYRFCSLSEAIFDTSAGSSSITASGGMRYDGETQRLLVRLNEWFEDGAKRQSTFLKHLFALPSAVSRIGSCVHSPGFRDEIRSCLRARSLNSQGASSQAAGGYDPVINSDLHDDARLANNILAHMMAIEKCDTFVMNPLFGSGLPYKVGQGQPLVQYYARGRPEPISIRQSNSLQNNSESSDSGSWMDDYPLHKYSINGNVEALKMVLREGYDVNQLDRDAWAPIHYAAWYGQLGAVQTLLNYDGCLVNVKNRNGSTPLHFAAWCGHQYVTELLLSHSDINLNIKDKDGKTPLDLCNYVPKRDWQAVAKLLQDAQANKLPKIQVDLMDDTNLMLSLANGSDTTAAQLHSQVCSELKLKSASAKIFAIWICSDSLQLQLKAQHKPLSHMNSWQKVLSSFCECSTDSVTQAPRLSFRRNAHLSVQEERKLLSDASAGQESADVALTLLYHEAQRNYIKGLYPCSDGDAALLGATFLQIIQGNFDSKKDKQFLSNDKALAKLLPQSKLKNKSHWISKIISEHKQFSKMTTSKNISSLQFSFLSFCWNLRVYGSAFFDGMIFVDKGRLKGNLRVHVGVNDFGLHLIHFDTKAMFKSCPYKSLEWQFLPNRNFLEIRTKESSTVEVFTLHSAQASLINTLLTKLTQSVISKQKTAMGSLATEVHTANQTCATVLQVIV